MIALSGNGAHNLTLGLATQLANIMRAIHSSLRRALPAGTLGVGAWSAAGAAVCS
jgi:hypothetical protein